MRILMLGWEFPPYIKGGLGVASASLAKEIAKRGHTVTFALPYRLPVSSKYFDIIFAGSKPTIEEFYNSYNSNGSYIIEDESKENEIRLHSIRDEALLFAKRLKRMIKNINYDIVHAHDWLTIPAGTVAQKSHKPMVTHIHATEFDRSGGQGVNQAVYEIEQTGMQQANHVLPVSSKTKEYITKQYEIDESKITIVHNGVSVSSWESLPRRKSKTTNKSKLVLFVGRLTIQKGVDYLIDAAEMVVQHEPNARFVVIGDGDQKAQLVHQVITKNLFKHFQFISSYDTKEIASYYEAADLFVMPSVSEPFGLVALEASLFNTPVIISKTSGVKDVFKHCLQVDFWDTRLLASHIVSVLKYRSLKTDLAHNGNRNARQITWEKSAEKVEQVYNQLLT